MCFYELVLFYTFVSAICVSIRRPSDNASYKIWADFYEFIICGLYKTTDKSTELGSDKPDLRNNWGKMWCFKNQPQPLYRGHKFTNRKTDRLSLNMSASAMKAWTLKPKLWSENIPTSKKSSLGHSNSSEGDKWKVGSDGGMSSLAENGTCILVDFPPDRNQ